MEITRAYRDFGEGDKPQNEESYHQHMINAGVIMNTFPQEMKNQMMKQGFRDLAITMESRVNEKLFKKMMDDPALWLKNEGINVKGNE